MRAAIPVQVKVVVSILRLATGNSMQSIAYLYKIGLSTSQVAVSQFCSAMKTLLLKKFICWPSTEKMDKLTEEFESLHGIPYVVGAVDGSHIPIVAPVFMPLIITIEKVFIPFSCKVLCRAIVCFGISISAGQGQCTMPTCGLGQTSDSFVRPGDYHLTP